MIVSKFVYSDLEGMRSAERELRAAVDEIAQSTRECIFINVLHHPEQILVVQSETQATGQLIRKILNSPVAGIS